MTDYTLQRRRTPDGRHGWAVKRTQDGAFAWWRMDESAPWRLVLFNTQNDAQRWASFDHDWNECVRLSTSQPTD